MCAMLVASGLNPQAVPITSLLNFVAVGPYLGMVSELVFTPEHATEAPADDEPWWTNEVDD